MDEFETLEDYQNSLKEFNERTRKSYEDFIQEHGDDSQKLQLRCTPYTEKKGRYGVTSLDFGFQIWQSRQAEVDQLQSQINEMAEVGLSQESVIREKDKRIETLITTWRNQTKELCNVDDKHVREALLSCADELEVLRGEHE